MRMECAAYIQKCPLILKSQPQAHLHYDQLEGAVFTFTSVVEALGVWLAGGDVIPVVKIKGWPQPVGVHPDTLCWPRIGETRECDVDKEGWVWPVRKI